MTDVGEFYFYTSHPAIETSQDFNRDCTRKETSSAILGCYATNRIYIYNVPNEQLDGIQEVTAAHETLHAIYQRMSQGEKAVVDPLLEKEFDKRKGDKSLTERMAYYNRTEVGERDNELHSILGTEYGDLDPVLEKHYAKYFKDRQAVVTLHTKYATVFNNLAAKADSLSGQLKALAAKIEQESTDYNAAVKALNSAIQSFNARAAAGDFSSQAQFNSQRSSLMSRADTLDTQRQTINDDIVQYNKTRDEYNQTANTSNDLYKSIDSNLAPAPSV